MKVLSLFAFASAATLGLVKAECPNACSGHGRCTNYKALSLSYPDQANKVSAEVGISEFGYHTDYEKKDSCTCFTHKGYDGSDVYAWTGADCSLRTCPYGPAHADTPDGVDTHSAPLECSGKGICDRKTGQCQCFNGYTGLGCKRTTCPNDCSGNGQCLPLKKIAEDVAAQNGDFLYATNNVVYATAFDAETQYGCICDTGRMGADCSIVQCPSSTDPMGGAGAESGRPCSGRGLCDRGTCACFTGYFGTQCEKQRGRSG